MRFPLPGDTRVYLNNAKNNLPCVFDENLNKEELHDRDYYNPEFSSGWWKVDDDKYFPNTLWAAAYAFGDFVKLYNAQAYGCVTNADEPLRVGIKGNMKGENWACWDNFCLFASDTKQYIPVHIGTTVSQHGEYTLKCNSTDGTIHMGMTAEKEGTNWHTIQIKWLKRLGDLSLGIDSISSDVQQDVWYDL